MNCPHEVPHCDTHGCFVDGLGRHAATPNALADDSAALDPSAVVSVLQFGAILPPLSPWQGIRRLEPGYQHEAHGGKSPIPLGHPHGAAQLDPDQQARQVRDLLDRILKRLIGDRRDPVLLFSGGVDSGLLAARLVALGFRESLLLNYSFGQDDPESLLAEAMAKHLGLRFERIFPRRSPCECLRAPGGVYPQPFSDQSTAPTWDFARTVVERLAGCHRLILDGTGADGAFGMNQKIARWSRVVRTPALLRRSASFVYGRALWHSAARWEYPFRVARRSAILPLPAAAVAQNTLAGILYRAAPGHSLDGMLSSWVGSWAGESMASRIMAADLALICANIFAQKGLPILEGAGHVVAYPFLDSESVSFALSAVPSWAMDEAKAPLKLCLAGQVPREMVYRAKSGFIDPRRGVFHAPEFIAHLRATLDDSGPISPYLCRRPALKACDLLHRHRSLPAQTLDCLWGITFTDRWIRSAGRGSGAHSSPTGDLL